MSQEKSNENDEKPEIINISGDGEDQKATKTQAGIKDYLRILTFSSRLDWILNGVGAVAAIASGSSLAL